MEPPRVVYTTLLSIILVVIVSENTYIVILYSLTEIPSIPHGNMNENFGYDFSTEEGKLASYFYVLEQLGKIRPEGTDLLYNQFYDSNFFLPFAISCEPNTSYSPELRDRIMSRAISTNGRFDLYLKFAKPLDGVYRAVILYRQYRQFSMNSERSTFKDYENEQ